MESLRELREKVQAPVRRYNDVAGVLVGDRVSIHITRLFVALNLSPTVATLSFLLFGLLGSVLILFGGGHAVVGFVCLFVYYILDCVDGEVARYHGREKLIWGFHDFMFHLYVKSAFYVCLGIYAARASGEPWFLFFALSALLACVFEKFLHDVSLILTCRYVLLRSPEERERYINQVVAGARAVGYDALAERCDHSAPEYRGFLPFVRTAFANFDLAVLLFLVASVADMFVEPFQAWHITIDAKIALLAFYGIVLPLDFLDRLQSHIRSRRFFTQAAELLRCADDFRLRR